MNGGQFWGSCFLVALVFLIETQHPLRFFRDSGIDHIPHKSLQLITIVEPFPSMMQMLKLLVQLLLRLLIARNPSKDSDVRIGSSQVAESFLQRFVGKTNLYGLLHCVICEINHASLQIGYKQRPAPCRQILSTDYWFETQNLV